MERIRADEIREVLQRDWDVDMLEFGLIDILHRVAYTIDEMDKDIAIMEINREALRRALHDEESR